MVSDLARKSESRCVRCFSPKVSFYIIFFLGGGSLACLSCICLRERLQV